jgi:hypothetical protein
MDAVCNAAEEVCGPCWQAKPMERGCRACWAYRICELDGWSTVQVSLCAPLVPCPGRSATWITCRGRWWAPWAPPWFSTFCWQQS